MPFCCSFWKKRELVSSGSPANQGLVMLAKKFLTPAATTVDVERLFSECGFILNKKRNALNPDRKNIFLINFDINWE